MSVAETRSEKLTIQYEGDILLFIAGDRSASDRVYEGLREISYYLADSFMLAASSGGNFQMRGYPGKKAAYLYSVVFRNVWHGNRADTRDQLFEIIFDSALSCVGIGMDKKKRFRKSSENSYFLKYLQAFSYYEILKFLESSSVAWDGEVRRRALDSETGSEEEGTGDADYGELIRESGMGEALKPSDLEDFIDSLGTKEESLYRHHILYLREFAIKKRVMPLKDN